MEDVKKLESMLERANKDVSAAEAAREEAERSLGELRTELSRAVASASKSSSLLEEERKSHAESLAMAQETAAAAETKARQEQHLRLAAESARNLATEEAAMLRGQLASAQVSHPVCMLVLIK